jgi:hypothetical protein
LDILAPPEYLPPRDKQPAAAPVAFAPSKAKFDRNAYQREYMRRRRATAKVSPVST